MDIKAGEALHRFVVFQTEDGKQIKVVSKRLKDKRIAAELVIVTEAGQDIHKFVDSANNSETFDANHFDEVLNNLKKIENGQFKKVAQKKFLGMWNFTDAREIPVEDLI
ncbi:MAG: hypothetical protein ABIF85_06600 [Nanoarchaeota archaeon]|nr:hypothetical protein [Nanoarchaeota archaeon]MBU4451319.1 hypothetical protein [Nanoarchaeota archaeon]MCG2723280.1 hypothetical protein [archaeon]